MLVVLQISCVLIILVMYKVSPARLVVWYSRAIRCLVPNTPFANKAKIFPDSSVLENNYTGIRDELIGLAHSGELENCPVTGSISEHDRFHVAQMKGEFKLQLFDEWVNSSVSKMPYTNALLCEIPQVTQAVIRVFKRGEHIPLKSHLFRGVLTYHLPLFSHTEGRNYIICGNIHHNYKEGVGILVDETFKHELWNNLDGPQVFLSLHISRDKALPRLVRPFNRILINLLSQSQRMQRAVKMAEEKLAEKPLYIQDLQKINQS